MRIRLTALLITTFAFIFAPPAGAAKLVFEGPGYIDDARAVAFAPDGDIWVGGGGGVEVFGPDGVYKGQETDTYPGGQVNSIVFDAAGHAYYGMNGGGVVSLQGDKRITMGGFGNYSPWEIVFDRGGNLLATDGGNGDIARFNPQGVRLQTLTGPPAASPDAMGRPYSLALDSQQRLFVSDETKPGLWVFGSDGKYLGRILANTQFWRIRRAGALLYAMTNDGVALIDPASGAITGTLRLPRAGYNDAMGFAIDSHGDFYLGNHGGCSVLKTDPTGKPLQTLAGDYHAEITSPDAWTAGVSQPVDVAITYPATKPSKPGAPEFSAIVQPAVIPGDPDLNFANDESGRPDPAWVARRDAIFRQQAHDVTLAKSASGYNAVVPDGATTDLYTMIWSVVGDESRQQRTPVSVAVSGVHSSLTLFVPRHRSVFQQGESIEMDAIIRSEVEMPAQTLRFSLVPRPGDSLAFTPGAPVWKTFATLRGASRTMTFHIDSGAIQPGRYLLQAEFGASGSLHDVWPIQVVSPVQTTRFRILFPEWSAGYTQIWGPFHGDGMQADAAKLAGEGIEIYDTLMVNRGTDPPLNADPQTQSAADQEVLRAQADPALPAPEKFIPPSPLEIELQEALRNNMTVQRDIWGSHFLNAWGDGDTLGIERDNRGAQIWTQYQREWPSWIGHRYLTLSLDEGQNPERVALETKFTAATGMAIPTSDELDWVRNGSERQLIANCPSGNIYSEYSAIGTDGAGNVYVLSRAGELLKYSADAALLGKVNINAGETIDMAVAADGTCYIAHMGGTVTTVTPDGRVTHWYDQRFSSHSPRGITLESTGNLLCSDMDNHVIREYTRDGKWLRDIGSDQNLKTPAGITTSPNGNIFVLDGDAGGVMEFQPDGTPIQFIHAGSHTFGGKGCVIADGNGTLWVTEGWGAIRHVDLTGKQIDYIGRPTFAPGGIAYPTSICLARNGDILTSDVALPWAQEVTPDGKTVHLFGFGNIFAELRVDRHRYTDGDGHILASYWYPIQGYPGDPEARLQAFASVSGSDQPHWVPLAVQGFGGGVAHIDLPPLEGKVTLRLVLDKPGASAEDPIHADFEITVNSQTPQADVARAADIFHRQQAWTTYWAQNRMGTLVRWTQLSDAVAVSGGHAPTQDTAPTNYGTPDYMAEGVYIPFRRDAVVAEAENEGHDHGTFPMMGPWYVARALEGPNPKPAWSSELRWFWETGDHKDVARRPRPERDYTLLLGAGATGIGTGTAAFLLPPKALATHRKMVDRLQRVGEACAGLALPGQGGVAVLHSFTEEVMDPYGDEQFYAAHAAWYDLVRAHVPTGVVSEEAIAHGDLIGRFKAVLLPFIQFPLPRATMDGLQQFRQSGGRIWVDLNCRISVPGAQVLGTMYRPYWGEDTYFSIRNGVEVDGYDGNWEYWRMKEGSNDRLPALIKAFSDLVRMPVATDNPDVFVMVRHGGQATYEFVGNDKFPDKPLVETWLTSDAPVPADVTFAVHGGATYDAYAMKRVPDGDLPVSFTDDEPARLWVSLPSAVSSVALAAHLEGDRLAGAVSVLSGSGSRIPAVVPIELHITDPSGATVLHIFRATDATGRITFSLPVEWMAPRGHWRVAARELLSGIAATPVDVQVGDEAPAAMTQEDAAAMVFDKGAIAKWLAAMRGQEVWIALGDQDSVEPVAQALANALTQYGVHALVVHEKDFPETPINLQYKMADADAATLEHIKSGNVIGVRSSPPGQNDFITVGPRRMILRPLILLGDPAHNPWLADIDTYKLARRQLSPLYPGPGRALVQYVWAPFWDGYDAVTVEANDDAGLRAGVNAMLGH